VAAALGGQAKAYESLFQNYRTLVYHVVLKMVRDVDDAEDLTMEVFAKAFRHLEPYVPQLAFSTWLFRIASNHGIDFVRRKYAATVSLQVAAHVNAEGESTLELCDNDPDRLEAYMQRQRRERVQEAVVQLLAKYQRILQLRYFEELSYEEVAATLQRPIGTVTGHLHQARARLLAQLQGQAERF
jgi:RNA polymerase sigma-70 factor (ECF subfamily)